MSLDPALLLAVLGLVVAVAAFALLARRNRGLDADVQRLRLLAEQALQGQRGEGETTRAALAASERALAAAIAGAGGQLRVELAGAIADMRTSLDRRLTELREGNEQKLGEIHKTVNEQLHEAVERQMTASFTRVTEQFAQVQKAMGEMQAVGAQIGDLKRLFGNVKTRGGWGETQVRAMLDDILPAGAYDTNWRPRPDSADAVEFAVIMPTRGAVRPRLPVDAKFPVVDYENLLTAAEAGDADAERTARRALERRVREEARKIADKYIVPPATVEFAVMYLPTDGLFAEVARIDGLIDELGRVHRVLVLGPSLFPALLRTIHLGHVTLALEQKADEVRLLLGATRTEMQKMDGVLDRLGKQANTFSNTIASARQRTKAVDRKLRSVEAMEPEKAAQLIGPVDGGEDVAEEDGDAG
jgi:DNA recombination protein RmuC